MFDYWNNRDLGREAQRQDDRRTRERLEKQSPSGARVDFVGHLNAISHADASRQAPGLTALEDIRRRQRTAKVDAYGAQNPFRAQTAPTSNFDFSSRDPGNKPGRYGTWAEGAPTLRPGERVRDAAGSLTSDDRRALDHWASGKVGNISPEFLLDVARELISMAQSRAHAERPV